MTFPKPEYIQNFLDEKFKKDKRVERITLLDDDGLSSEHDDRVALEESSGNKTDHSRNSSAISESDDNRRVAGGGLEPQHKQSSDADCETDDSYSSARKPNSANGLGTRRIHQKKSRDAKTPLCSAAGNSGGYGGTSEVELDCAETLASYSHNGTPVKGIVRAAANASADASYQHLKNSDAGTSKSSGPRKRNNHEKGKNMGNRDHEHHIHGNEHHSHYSNDDSPLPSEVESEHCHDSSDEKTQRENKKRQKAMRKLLIATGLSFLFMVGEIVGGFLANSLAIMTDASHLLTDVSSFLISIIALKMAARPISKKMTFGWHRAEVIGALVSVVAIWIVTGVLVYLAVMRLINNKYEVHGKTMLITASLAVGFNILMGLVLHEHSHTHGHSHGHSHGGSSHDHDHDLRIWSLTLNQTVMSAHLAIDKSTDPNIVLKRATRRLKSLYDFHSLTIQVEYYSNDMDECKKCQPA
uniref:Uncharacterized protein n=1 Tax=Ciona savignyi TaxID=51511 RepID=H2YXQ5_CIOSA